MPLIYFLAPKLLVVGPLMILFCLAAARWSGLGETGFAFRRLGRSAAVLTFVALVPVAMVLGKVGFAPGAMQQELASNSVAGMGSIILR